MSAIATPENVLLVSVDQLSAKWLEEPHSAIIPTPTLDRLRAAGTTFTNAYTSNPLCAPARATLATGLTTRQHGVLMNGYRLRPDLPTFMHRLRDAGWRTGGFGKFHFTPQFVESHPAYESYGFDECRITEDQRLGEWLDWIRSEHPWHFNTALATIPNIDLPALRSYGPHDEDLLHQVVTAKRAIDWDTRLDWEEQEAPNPAAYALPFPEELSQTNWITDHAVSFVENATSGWCAHVSYVQPHPPNTPPQRFLDRVDTDAITDPIEPTWPDDPDRPACFDRGDPKRHTELDNPNGYERRRYYFADIAHLDAQLGRLLDAVDLEETSVIFLSDHGELLFDHGFSGKGQKHYDASIRIPLVIAGAGVQRGAVIDHFVQLEDVCPTILDLADVTPEPRETLQDRLEPLPAGYPDRSIGSVEDLPEHFPGRSLRPLLAGEPPTDWRESAYVESFNNIYSANPAHWARTIRTERYRYTRYPAHGGEQLFDLSCDAEERTNLAADPEHEAVRGRLRDRLLDRMILQDHPITPRDLVAFGMP